MSLINYGHLPSIPLPFLPSLPPTHHPTMSTQFIVRYDPSVSPHTGSAESYKLLEISPELAKVVEQAGKEGEEGVVCVPWFLLFST